MQPLVGTTVAHFVVGILAVFAPGNWSSIFFAKFPTGLERDRLEDVVGLDVSTLSEDMDKALGPQWARPFGVTGMARSDHELPLWSNGAVFAGDFGGLIDILREAASTSAATDHMYRGLEFFKVTIPRYLLEESYDLYFAVLDSGTLFVAKGYEGSGLQLVQEALDRRIDAAELDESLESLLWHTTPMDLLFVINTETYYSEPQDESEYPYPRLVGLAGLMNEGATTTLKYHYEFDDPAHAEQIEPLLSERTLRGYGNGKEYPVTDVRRAGNVLAAQAVVDDSEVGGFVFGN